MLTKGDDSMKKHWQRNLLISCWAVLLLTGCNSKEKSFIDINSGEIIIQSETKNEE